MSRHRPSSETACALLHRLAGRFQVQLMVRFLAIVVLLAVLISILFFQSMSSEQLERQARLLDQQAVSHMTMLNSRIKAVEDDAISILGHSTIKDYLTYPYRKPATQVQDALYSFQPLVRWVMTINTQYLRIRFLTNNETTSGDTYVGSLDEYIDSDWVQATIQSPTRSHWQNLHPAERFLYTYPLNEDVVTYSLYSSTGHYMAVLDTSAPWLYQEIPFVLDTATGRILYSTLQPEAVGETCVITQEKQVASTTILDKAYYVHALSNDTLGVTILACTERGPVQEAIFGQTQMFTLWTIVFITVALVLLTITSSSVVKRMSLISSNVSQITQGRYDVSYTVSRNDELDDLGADIVSMANQMNQLVNQRLNQQMLLQEAEFRALQQQINPHFIFNILQTMQMIAEMNDQTDLADMIAQFGRMVRYNLYATMNVPLEEELNNVRDYLMLQKVMYNDELEMHIDMTGIPSTLEVPRLLLQPLVENAVLHGRIKGQMLHVKICGEHTGEGIRMRIRNDGKPLTQEREAELKRVLEDVCRNPGSVDGGNAKDNLALINIQKRLLICFGPDCHLHIGNDTDGTVLVEFTIPDKEVAL